MSRPRMRLALFSGEPPSHILMPPLTSQEEGVAGYDGAAAVERPLQLFVHGAVEPVVLGPPPQEPHPLLGVPPVAAPRGVPLLQGYLLEDVPAPRVPQAEPGGQRAGQGGLPHGGRAGYHDGRRRPGKGRPLRRFPRPGGPPPRGSTEIHRGLRYLHDEAAERYRRQEVPRPQVQRVLHLADVLGVGRLLRRAV